MVVQPFALFVELFVGCFASEATSTNYSVCHLIRHAGPSVALSNTCIDICQELVQTNVIFFSNIVIDINGPQKKCTNESL